VTQLLSGSKALRARYEVVATSNDPRSAVAAQARLAQTALRVAQIFLTVEIPKDVRTGEYADDKIQAFCDKLTEVAEAFETAAKATLEACVARSSQLAVVDEASGICERELQQLDPMKYPSLDEALPSPWLATLHPDLTPPLATVTDRSVAAALEQFRKHEGKWTDAACTSSAARFAAITSDPASAQYMAGLSHHRCNRHADAMAAYQKAIAANPRFTPALVNIGVALYATGKLDDAIKYWETAIRADGKHLTAYIDLGIGQLAQLAKLGTDDPKRGTLRDEITRSLTSALAIDSDSAKAYLALAVLYFDGSDRNRNRLDLARLVLDEAKRLDPKNPAIQNAFGTLAVRRKQTNVAVALFQAAAGDLDASFNLALLSLSIRKWDAARQLLAKVTPTYDSAIALAVALRGAKRFVDAEGEYARAIRIDARRPDAYFNLGLLYMHHIASAAADLPRSLVAYRKAQEHFANAIKHAGTSALGTTAKQRLAYCDKIIAQTEMFLRMQQQQPPKKP
jgi:tetratricopeptide (TPR) repeat protein